MQLTCKGLLINAVSYDRRPPLGDMHSTAYSWENTVMDPSPVSMTDGMEVTVPLDPGITPVDFLCYGLNPVVD